ncbi:MULTISPECIES: hypothetical protein [Nocardiopsis]|uniref:Ig-like domain-containing protein n=1 Tax=Nocardiopsis sinuspersici TaxID=501010 RepID=A0A1V3C0R5_9ACTN|nr:MULTISPECIES: hypothetical protein [Nocardiopsis]OOC54253.1 hypothetical protein NOSIN_10915 [Nocardiopsis sinuspersici]
MYVSIPHAQGEYGHALRELRRGIGCTPDRLSESTLLERTLRERIESRGEEVTADRLIMELTHLIDSIGDPKFRESLLVALRLDLRYRQRTLMERRRNYNRDLRNSPDSEMRRLHVDNLRTMERRENKATEQVARYLDDGLQVSDRAHLRDFPLRPIAPQGELAVEAISYSCAFSDTGVLRTQDVTRWVRATSPQTSPELTVTHRYFNENKTGLLDIESLYGCRVVERSETVSGDLLARISIHKDLAPTDGVYSFGSRISVNSDATCRPVIVWRPRTSFTRRIEFHLRFGEPHLPVRAWWFVSSQEVEGELEPPPSEGRHLEHLDEGRYLYRIFENEDITPDLRYGISWVWPG